MQPRAPALLLVLVETAKLRWFVAGITLDGHASPLLRSDVGDLAPYADLEFDEQVGFLRHRFCGALQRGSHRLWERGQKACDFVFVFEGRLPEPTGALTQRVADHFVEWMASPPVVVYASADGIDLDGPPALDRLAGQLDPAREELLVSRLGDLLRERDEAGKWERYRKQPT